MGQDQQTYRRAASAALIGLGVQVVLAIGMGLVGLWSASPAIQAATWHISGGLLVWFILFLLYNQHRIERAEALEAEQLARRDQQAAALFSEHADDLDLARRRLDRLNKWGLSITSLLLSVYLVTAGIILFYRNYQQHQAGTLIANALNAKATQNALILMFLLAAMTFLAFIVARYVAGMTRVREWQQLRGGAGYLMSTMVLALILAVGALCVALDYRGVMSWLALIVPAVMVLVGFEVLVTFLLSAYRPRRPGEVPRPAFDSRVLGLLTAPESLGSIISETINYQFGFEITSSWFYRLLSKAVTPLIVLGAAVLIGISSIVVVAPHEEVVITRFGDLTGVKRSGMYLKWPWPIGRAQRYVTGRIHQVSVGSLRRQEGDVAILWTNQHAQETEEKFLVTGPTPVIGDQPRGEAPEDAAGQGGALIAAEVVMHYTIADLEAYLRSSQNPEAMIKAMAERQVSVFFAGTTIDNLLGGDRVIAGTILRDRIQKDVDDAKLGLRVAFVGVTSVHPPQKNEVAASFHKEVGALQEREGMIEDARKEATRLLASVAGTSDRALEINKAVLAQEALRQQIEKVEPAKREELAKQVVAAELEVERLMEEARGEAAVQIYEARAYRWTRAITERAKAERFESELAAYRAAPRYYAMRQYLDALVEGMMDTRKTVLTVPQANVPAIFRLDFKEASSALDSILEGNN